MNKALEEDKYFARVQKICLIEVIFNYVLTSIKFLFGIFGGSKTLISDGVNSLGDIVTTTFSLIGIKMSSKKADEEHQFGHAKIEALVCLIFSFFLIFGAIILSYNSIMAIINKSYLEKEESNMMIALIGAIIAMSIKLILFILTFTNYKITKSSVLKAQSLDHFTDSFSTLLSLISIIVIYIINEDYIYILDEIFSLIIGIMIVLGAIKIAIDNSSILLDRAVKKGLEKEFIDTILAVEGVLHIDALRNRLVGNQIFIEVEITCERNITLLEGHVIAENVRTKLLENYSDVKHVLVHVNPDGHLDEIDL